MNVTVASCVVLSFGTGGLAADDAARVVLEVQEATSNETLPCRIHLKNAANQVHRPAGLPFWRDHFVSAGTVQLQLMPGEYSYEIERGPEYRTASGSFRVAAGEERRLAVRLERIANLAADGWWSGELHVHRPLDEIELLMRAEDLHVAPVITWWNKRNVWDGRPVPEQSILPFDSNRYFHPMGGEDEREGGALLFFHLLRPLAIAGSTREYPSPMRFVRDARRESKDVWIDIEKPFWWDVPVWLASGEVDSIGIANNHMCRSQMYESEAWGRPRDAERLPPPRGNGFWTQEIYYHILNSGIRVAPSAGSASGVLPNPVGYNRVYVQLGNQLDYAAWWQGLRAGRSFVTNGPLLRVAAAGRPPGHVFTTEAGKEVSIELSIHLVSHDAISAVEIIQNGEIARRMTGDDWSKTNSLGMITFRESGWFLVRAIAENSKTFRFASTAPYYVEIGEPKRRVSRASTQFFLDWVNERMARVKLEDPAQRREVLSYHDIARQFWETKVAAANAP